VSEYVHKIHNVTVLIYHLVFPAKYRRAAFDKEVDEVMKDVCVEIEDRYQMKFLEIGTNKDHGVLPTPDHSSSSHNSWD